MGRTLRVGIIGYGKAGALIHASLVSATQGLTVAAIATSSAEKQARARREFPDAALFPTGEALLAAGGLELAVIASPNRTHVPLALAALGQRIAVVVDKPMAQSSAAALELVAAAERAGTLLTVFHNRRWDSDFLTVQRLVGDGRLGALLRVESRYEEHHPVPNLAAWRERPEPEEAGGLLFDLGPHLIDQARILLGEPQSVYAELAARRPCALVDDEDFVSLRFGGGQLAHLWMSACAVRPGPRFRVCGERGTYEKRGLDPQEEQLLAGLRPGNAAWGTEPQERWGHLFTGGDPELVASAPGSYERFYALVRDALLSGGPPPIDPLDAIAGLRIIEAARRSAASGQVVPL